MSRVIVRMLTTSRLAALSAASAALVALAAPTGAAAQTLQFGPGGSAAAAGGNVSMPEQNAGERVRLENPEGAPLTFTEVVLKPHRPEGETGKTYVAFSLTVRNQTDRAIKRFAYTQTATAKAKTELYAEQHVTLAPRASHTFLVQVMPKEPEGLTVRMTGVQFEDGTQWGTLHTLSSEMLTQGVTLITTPERGSLFGEARGTLLGGGPSALTGKDAMLNPAQPSMLNTGQGTMLKPKQ